MRLPGRRVLLAGRYELIDELGSGGMGTVYRATDRTTGQTVAVKVLHAFLRHEQEFVDRFKREARIAMSLQSPNIVKVLEVGQDDEFSYLIVEYVDGVNLAELMRACSLSTAQSLGIAAQITAGLSDAHAAGVVHRDVKPENVLIGRDGDVKLGDLGIARIQGLASTLGTTGASFLGSLAHAAPEAFSGEVDARSDIYSLGAVLYQMLAGRAPFVADTPFAFMQQHIESTPPPLTSSQAPSVIAALVESCLAKMPEQRPALAELRRVLAHHLDGQDANLTLPEAVRRKVGRRLRAPGASARASRQRFNPPVVFAGVLAVLGLGVAATYLAWPRSGDDVLVLGSGPLEFLGTDRIAFLSDRDGSYHAYLADATGTARVSEQPVSPGGALNFSPDGSQVVLTGVDGTSGGIAIADSDWGEVRQLTDGSDGGAKWSPDGSRILFTRLTGRTSELYAIGIDGSGLTRLGEGHGGWWSPDGTRVAVARDGQVRVLNADSMEVASTVEGIVATWLAWSPDGAQIVLTSHQGETSHLYVVNSDGSGLRQLTNMPGISDQPAWSPDGALIAFMSFVPGNASEVYTIRPDGRDQKRLTNDAVFEESPAWSPDGQRLAFIGFRTRQDGDRFSNGEIYVMNRDGSGQVRITDHPGEDLFPVWLPAPKLTFMGADEIAFVRESETSTPELFLASAEGLKQLTGAHSSLPAWSPDGRQLAFTGGSSTGPSEVFVINKDGGGRHRLAEGMQPSWSPDGKRIAFFAVDGGRLSLFVVNADGSGVSRIRAAGTAGSSPAQWSPDGRLLLMISPGNDPIIVNADGTGEFALTEPTNDATWSPNGELIAFSRPHGGGRGADDNGSDIFTIRPDGSGLVQLTSDTGYNVQPAWSPDGSRLAFVSTRDGSTTEIYVINADGSRQERLTRNNVANDAPAWSPDGTRLVFMEATQTGTTNAEILVLSLSDRKLHRVTRHPAMDIGPVWAPRHSAAP